MTHILSSCLACSRIVTRQSTVNASITHVRAFAKKHDRKDGQKTKKRTMARHALSPHVAKSKFLPAGQDSVTTTLGRGTNFAVLSEVSRKHRVDQRNILTKVTNFSQLKVWPALRNELFTYLAAKRTAAEVKLNEDMIRDLEDVITPTPIQKIALKSLGARSRDHGSKYWLMAAETGSGKTLAYLLPVLNKILEAKSTAPPESSNGNNKGLKAVILVPSIDLVHQVYGVLQSLEKNLPFTAAASLPETASKVSRKLNAGFVDVLVSTPDRVRSQSNLRWDSCQTIVVDEADTLMDDTFREGTEDVINRGTDRAAVDVVFVSATIPKRFDRILREKYPTTFRLVTPSIHKLPSHIQLHVVDIYRPPYNDRKDLALTQALYGIFHDKTEPGLCKRVVVFVNNRDSVAPLVDTITKAGFNAIGIDKTVKSGERRGLIKEFVNPPVSLDTAGRKTPDSDEQMKVLVCTDILARGVDMQRIRNVILYDVPRSSADMLHRAGRTGRNGGRGRVLLLVNKKESDSWVKGLEKVSKKGLALA